ncbi:MAG: hypothetical protein PHG69_00015, partial [Candidatus Omnitrophica bacterium]|nr:hypothetical protein [Candidatus Omnitrophota bacterium]
MVDKINQHAIAGVKLIGVLHLHPFDITRLLQRPGPTVEDRIGEDFLIPELNDKIAGIPLGIVIEPAVPAGLTIDKSLEFKPIRFNTYFYLPEGTGREIKVIGSVDFQDWLRESKFSSSPIQLALPEQAMVLSSPLKIGEVNMPEIGVSVIKQTPISSTRAPPKMQLAATSLTASSPLPIVLPQGYERITDLTTGKLAPIAGSQAVEFKTQARQFITKALRPYLTKTLELVIEPLKTIDFTNPDMVRVAEISDNYRRDVIDPLNTIRISLSNGAMADTGFEEYANVAPAIINTLTIGQPELDVVDIMNKGFGHIALLLTTAKTKPELAEKYLVDIQNTFERTKSIISIFDSWLAKQDSIQLAQNIHSNKLIDVDLDWIEQQMAQVVVSSPLELPETFKLAETYSGKDAEGFRSEAKSVIDNSIRPYFERAKQLISELKTKVEAEGLSKVTKAEIKKIQESYYNNVLLPLTKIVFPVIRGARPLEENPGLAQHTRVFPLLKSLSVGGEFAQSDISTIFSTINIRLDMLAASKGKDASINYGFVTEQFGKLDGIIKQLDQWLGMKAEPIRLVNIEAEEGLFVDNVRGFPDMPSSSPLKITDIAAAKFDGTNGVISMPGYLDWLARVRDLVDAKLSSVDRKVVAYYGIGGGLAPVSGGVEKIDIVSPLISTNFDRLIGWDFGKPNFDLFKIKVIEELKVITVLNPQDIEFAQVSQDTFRVTFPYQGKQREVEVSYDKDATKYAPQELRNGYHVLYSRGLPGAFAKIAAPVKTELLNNLVGGGIAVMENMPGVSQQGIGAGFGRIGGLGDMSWIGNRTFDVFVKIAAPASGISSPIDINVPQIKATAATSSALGERFASGLKTIEQFRQLQNNLSAPSSPLTAPQDASRQNIPVSRVPAQAVPFAPIPLPLSAAQSSPLHHINIGNVTQTALPIQSSYIASDPLALVGVNNTSLGIAVFSPMNASTARSPGVSSPLVSSFAYKCADAQKDSTAACVYGYNLVKSSKFLRHENLGLNVSSSPMSGIWGAQGLYL